MKIRNKKWVIPNSETSNLKYLIPLGINTFQPNTGVSTGTFMQNDAKVFPFEILKRQVVLRSLYTEIPNKFWDLITPTAMQKLLKSKDSNLRQI
jgi:hypothetical protein